MKYLLYSLSLPKRHAVMHWIYRRMYRAYGWFVGIPDMPINMDGTRAAFYFFFFAGPIFWLIIALLTLMIP